jgi:NAD(P)-dependent dehydrogenase (short-subunit alcohol dehydrogenase family)
MYGESMVRSALANDALAGRAVIVAGAGGGIGSAVVTAAVRAGARSVVAADLDEDRARTAVIAARTNAGGPPLQEIVDAAVDVTSTEACDDLVAWAEAEVGPLDGLVIASGINSATLAAGGGPQAHGPIVELDTDVFQRMLLVNLFGALNLARAFTRTVLGAGRGGSIVVVTSIAAQRVLAENAPYSVSKAALRTLTACLAVELAASGVRVNSVAPGYVDTAMMAGAGDGLLTGVPLGRVAEPAEIAESVCFLLSDATAYVTGTELVVDGGVLANRR